MLRRCSYSIDVIENIVTIHGSRIARYADTGRLEGIKDRVSALWDMLRYELFDDKGKDTGTLLSFQVTLRIFRLSQSGRVYVVRT